MVLLILVILGYPALTNSYESQDYQITNAKYNPGIYYEKLSGIRLYHTEWRLVTAIETKRLLSQKPDLRQAQRVATENCEKANQFPCHTNYELILLEKHMKELEKYEEFLEGTIQANNRTKRNAPLSFIGTISKALFGTLTEEESNYYNQEIDKLYADQNHISALLANQTHIVNSEFNRIHMRLQNLSDENQYLHSAVNAVVNELANQQNISDRQEFKAAEKSWLGNIKQSVEEYRLGLILITDAILFAKKGTIHPCILPPHQLVTAAENIKESTSYEFPLSSDELLSEQFPDVAKLEMAYIGGRLILEITIPLLDPKPFQLFQTHIFPTHQIYTKTYNVSTYIIPRSQYIALSLSNQYYFLLDDDYLNTCKHHHGQPLCKLTLPMHSTEKMPTCETTLLLDPKEINWKTCDIRVMHTDHTYWKKLRSRNTWIYSVTRMEEMRIICNGQVVGYERLTGAGTLFLEQGCEVYTESTHLTASGILEDKLLYHYAPPISLNLSSFSPPENRTYIDTLLKTIQRNTAKSSGNDWEQSKSAKSLTEIEEQAGTLANHHRQAFRTELTTYSSLSIGTVILLSGLAYCLYTFLRRRRPVAHSAPTRPAPARPEIVVMPPPVPAVPPAIRRTPLMLTQTPMPMVATSIV